MRRNELKSRASLVLLVAATAAFATGLVMLTCFHMDDGMFRAESLGLSRRAWLDLHRLSTLASLAVLVFHLALNWKALVGRVRSAARRSRAEGTFIELALYLAFTTMAASGLAAWLVEGAPLTGPLPLGPVSHARHLLVDVHNFSGLAALALSAHHAWHRWRQLVRGLVRRDVPAGRAV
jgi:hypothetical protein